MFCTECGAKLNDGSKFCTNCGTALESFIAVEEELDSENIGVVEIEVLEEVTPEEVTTEETPVAEDEVPTEGVAVEDEVPTEEVAAEDEEPEEVVSTEDEAPTEEVAAEDEVSEVEEESYVQPKKKNILKFVIPAVVVGGAAIAAAVILPKVLAGGSKGSQIFYLSDKKYGVVQKLKGEKTKGFDVTNSKIEDIYYYSDMAKFSPSGKYVYFFTKTDDYGSTGTLNRAEVAKLKEDSSKNEKYLISIDSKVQISSLVVISDTEVAYMTDDNHLYYYDGKEAQQIKKEVNSFNADEKGNILFTTGNRDDGYVLYGTTTKDVSDTTKLASNYANLWLYLSDDLSTVLYTKEDDDDKYTLYTVGNGKESEKLADEVSIVATGDNKIYYTANNGESVILYDLVNDGLASSDASAKEPSTSDYSVPTYSYYKVTSTSPSESAYSGLYTSVSKDLYWYTTAYGYSWYSFSMSDVTRYSYYFSDAIRTATQKFINKYSSSADSNGFITVTDTVKADLKAIVTAGGGSGDDWLELCYYRKQSGTTTDYEAYWAAYDEYEEAYSRQELREELKNPDNAFNLQNLYCYENGENKLIAEGIAFAGHESDNLLRWCVLDMEEISIDIEDFSSVSYLESAIEYSVNTEDVTFSILGDETTFSISEDCFEELEEEYDVDIIRVIGDTVYFGCDEGTILNGTIVDGVISGVDELYDDASILFVGNNTLYVIEDSYTSSNRTYGNLVGYKDGKSTTLAKDILSYSVDVYEDGTILAFTDYRSDHGGELSIINSKGEKTVIADDVTSRIRMDSSNVLYISDGDMYLYNGKKKAKVADDVLTFWADDYVKTLNSKDPYNKW